MFIYWNNRKESKMDASSIVTVVSQVGFPIAMCLVMAWYVKYTNDQHKEEIDKITEALNNNTLAVQKLCERMD